MKASDLPGPCRARNADILGKTALPPISEDELGLNIKSEADLQRACENGLTRRGYERMTVDTAERIAAQLPRLAYVKGLFVHMRNVRGNVCILPDLMVYNYIRPPLLCELKVPPIKYRPGQREFIEAGIWQLATSYDEWSVMLTAWERG